MNECGQSIVVNKCQVSSVVVYYNTTIDMPTYMPTCLPPVSGTCLHAYLHTKSILKYG